MLHVHSICEAFFSLEISLFVGVTQQGISLSGVCLTIGKVSFRIFNIDNAVM